MAETEHTDTSLEPGPRIIKRYSNRKLYDTRESRYVTLLQLADRIREGDEVRVVDNATKEDKTEVTLALIISEELKSRPRSLPLATLEALVRHRGGRVLSQLRGGPLGRLAWPAGGTDADPQAPQACETSTTEGEQAEPDPAEGPGGPLVRGLTGTLEQLQQVFEDRLRTLIPSAATVSELETRLDLLAERLANVERRLDQSARRAE